MKDLASKSLCFFQPGTYDATDQGSEEDTLSFCTKWPTVYEEMERWASALTANVLVPLTICSVSEAHFVISTVRRVKSLPLQLL